MKYYKWELKMKEFNQIIDIAFDLTGASPIAAKFLLSLKSGKYEIGN